MIEDMIAPIFARMITTAVAFVLPTENVFYLPNDETPPHHLFFTTIAEAERSMLDIRNRSIILSRILGQKLVLNNHLTPSDMQIVPDNLATQRAWLTALEALRKRSLVLSKQDELAIHLLQAQNYCLYVVTARTIPTTQTDFDAHLDDFKALVYHSTFVVDDITAEK